MRSSMAFVAGAGAALGVAYYFAIRPMTAALELSAEMGFMLVKAQLGEPPTSENRQKECP